MEEQKRVQESLRTLLAELQKVKDLNNLANEYKATTASLILSMQDYLNSSKDFSDSFTTYLTQTNQSVTDVRAVLDDAIKQLQTADSAAGNKLVNVMNGISQMELHISNVEGMYNKCVALEQHIREKTELAFTEMKVSMEKLADEEEKNEKKLEAVRQELCERLEEVKKKLSETHNEANQRLVAMLNTLRQANAEALQTLEKQVVSVRNQSEINAKNGMESIAESEKRMNTNMQTKYDEMEEQLAKIRKHQRNSTAAMVILFLAVMLLIFFMKNSIL